MKKNYIITAHKSPQQILRLITELEDTTSAFYIHINAMVEIEPFISILGKLPNVFFVEKREACIWGSFALVQAVINIMETIAKTENEGICIWLSGQDFPIKNIREINDFFHKNNGIDFIDAEPISKVWTKQAKRRTEYYRFNFSSKQFDYILLPGFFTKHFIKELPLNLIKILLVMKKLRFVKWGVLVLGKKRVHPENIIPHGGLTWWALTTKTIRKILLFIEENEYFVKYHQYTNAPDELFFHTIIRHLQLYDSEIKIMPSVTYVNWSGSLSKSSPAIFTSKDFDEIKKIGGGKLFARKFDEDVDKEIFEMISKTF